MKLVRILLFSALLIALAMAKASMPVPAVDTNGNGIITTIEVDDSKNGSGRVFVDIEPFISLETQNSAKVAARIAAQAAKTDLSGRDLYFKVVAQTEVVDGPSGGLALTLLAYSELTGRKLRGDLSATGTIEQDGSVGDVGGVMQKAEAGGGHGIKLFLVPSGQSVQGGIDLNAYAEKKWGMQVVEVTRFEDALKYAFTRDGEKVVAEKRVLLPLVLEDLAPLLSEPSKQFVSMAEHQLAYISGEKAMHNNSIIDEALGKAINDSKRLLEKGYYYSAANTAFLSRVAIDAYNSANLTRQEFDSKISQLEKELGSFEPAALTNENVEWAAGARLRYYWAKQRVKEIKDASMLVRTPALLVEDYSAAVNWLIAANEMNDVARSSGGENVDEKRLQQYAEDLLGQAQRTLTAYPLDSEAEDHLVTAEAAFMEGDFLASSFDSIYAISFAAGSQGLSGKVGGEVLASLENASSIKSFSGTVWPELYFVHSLYSVQEANRSNEFAYLVNAAKLQQLAKNLKMNLGEIRKQLEKKSLLPIATSTVIVPSIQAVITSGPAFPSNDAILLGIAVIVLALVLAAVLLAQKVREKKTHLSDEGRLQRLDDLLLDGKISEKTYERLTKKYSSASHTAGGGHKTKRR